MAAKFQIKRKLNGDYHFVLLSPTGRVIATSEDYKSRSGVLNAVKSVRTNAPGAVIEDQSTREWLAREAAQKPAAKAARAIGKVVGKAKTRMEEALAEPAPPPARKRAPAKKSATTTKRSPAKKST